MPLAFGGDAADVPGVRTQDMIIKQSITFIDNCQPLNMIITHVRCCTRSRDATHNGRTVGAAVHLFSYGQSLEPLPTMERSVQKVHMQ